MKSKSAFGATHGEWSPQPKAATFVRDQVQQACSRSPWLAAFRKRLLKETGTRLIDWLDHIAVANDDGLAANGFQPINGVANGVPVFVNPTGIFPKFAVVGHLPPNAWRLGIKVDRIEDFLAAHSGEIDDHKVLGDEMAQVRTANVEFASGGRICIVERHGSQSMVPGYHENATDVTQQSVVLDSFRTRDRGFDDSRCVYTEAASLINQAAAIMGKQYACDLFFLAEREYWQAKNRAARIQYQRQQSLGMGWANHDHHTYRSSRVSFRPLISTLELMGFECRERFYAGKDAGWGAQVLEHPGCGIVIFADVDLSENEVAGDFAHDGLEPVEALGTVGLWCELHGDSFGSAGLHHLECQFDFDAAREQLAAHGVETMAPFTHFPYLKQAFTQGETWHVDDKRLRSMVKAGDLTEENAQRFADQGVIGSHLEILERNDGFKGFNQTGVSDIIRKTNPIL